MWSTKMTVGVLCFIVPMVLAINATFELVFIGMALDDDHCYGRRNTNSTSDFGANAFSPNPCAVGMGTVAAIFVAVNWVPLALESYRHQGRSVSVNGVRCVFVTAA